MKATELLLFGLAGWTAIGVVGVGVRWFGGTAAGFGGEPVAGGGVGDLSRRAGWGFAAAATENRGDREPQCFDEMCFTVTGGGGSAGLSDSGWAAAGEGVGAGDEQREEGAERGVGTGLSGGWAGEAVGGVFGCERSAIDGAGGWWDRW